MRVLSAAFAVASIWLAPNAQAQEVTSQLVVGAAVRPTGWDLALGARGDFLFGRRTPRDFGLGPYLGIGTLGFRSLDFGAGASVLLPVDATFPLVVSAGGWVQAPSATDGTRAGLSGRIAFGSRSHNMHSWYTMSAMLSVEARVSLPDPSDASGWTFIVAADIDGFALTFPFLFLYQALFD